MKRISPVITAVGLLGFVCLAVAAEPPKSALKLDIAAQPVGDALNAFARQSGLQVVIDPKEETGVTAAAVSGTYTADDGLNALLANTGLHFDYLNARTVAVRSAHPSALAGASVSPAAAATTQIPLALAQTERANDLESPSTPSRPPQRAASPVSNELKSDQIEEILVTAQKRSERLQDVPVPVTALSSADLTDSNQLRLQDYYTRVPGLNVTTDDFGTPLITIRGLTTGAYTNPTVGIVVDDAPFGSSTVLGQGQEAPDFDPSDLARVEVLRGPQGTLYGASSLGGLIKYVTIDPSTDRISGRLEGGASNVNHGAEAGYVGRGAINVPLSDDLAIRASAFTRQDPGYVDNVFTGQNGINEGRASGGRLSALWRPSELISLKLSAVLQQTSIDGSPYVDPTLSSQDYQQNSIRNTGWYKQTLQAYNATFLASLPGVDITAVSGYNTNKYSDAFDYSSALGSCAPGSTACTQAQFGVTGTPAVNYQKTSKFTQEIRLGAPIGQQFEWLVGGFYDHENAPSSQNILAVEPVTGQVVGQWLHSDTSATYEEFAGFADLTWHFTDQFNVQIGGRESQSRQNSMTSYVGLYDPVFFGLPSPVLYPAQQSKDHQFTYLLTPQFKVSADLMLYARLASGYRPGGPNVSLGGVAPRSYGPDTTRNYEIGVKGAALGNALSFEASVYHIDWNHIQLTFLDPTTFVGYTANGSRAKSDGVEVSVEGKPVHGTTITAWVSWNKAVLTESLPPLNFGTGSSGSTALGSPGDRLPYSSRFSGNVSLQQDFRITNTVSGFVSGTVGYVGNREGVFASAFAVSPDRQQFPGYSKVDAHGGIQFEQWTVNAFVNNLANKRTFINGGIGTLNPNLFQCIQPRTAGVSLSRTF